MKVLKIVGSLQLGGTEQYIARIAPELRERGFEVQVCTLEREGPLLRVLEAQGTVVHGTRYGERSRTSNTLTIFRTIQDIARLVREGGFDLVQTYNFWAEVLGVAGAHLGGCRRVIISRRALHGWRHDRSAFQHTLEAAANLGARELVANSEMVLRDTERSERFLPRRRGVIYNGIDVATYRLARPSSGGPLRLVTVGAAEPRKGHDVSLRAVARLHTQAIPFHLTVVGSGSQEPGLRRLADKLGIGPSVTFAGQQLDPRPYLESADLFLLASRQEGFSNALLEAMASGLPVVATDVGGNAEALGEVGGGKLAPAGDSEALGRLLAELESRRELLPVMGQANRRRVEAVFSLTASADRLAEWYLHGPPRQLAPPGSP